jgi:fibronectin type 3 domain-containing protein
MGRSRKARTVSHRRSPGKRTLHLEQLEPRMLLSGVGDPPESIRLDLVCDEFGILTFADGTSQVVAPGLDGGGPAGAPNLPSRTLFIALPSDANLDTVSLVVSSGEAYTVTGTFDLAPAPLAAMISEDGAVTFAIDDPSIVDGRSATVYGQDALFDAEVVTLLTPQQMGRWKIAEVRYSPFAYNPVTGVLTLVDQATIEITYERSDPLPAGLMANTWLDAEALSLVENAGDAAAWYGVPSDGPAASSGDTLVIITTAAIQSNSTQLSAFVADKVAHGFTVVVATEGQWGGGSGNTAANNIRNWLIANYVSLSIDYVLLIGNPNPSSGDVPMKLCYPVTGYDTPTDYYYADLTSNWNADGDSRFGEWGQDFTSKPLHEVLVGRIPVYGSAYATLDGILAKTIAYDSATSTSWRQNILLPMAISNYANQDGSGYPRVDGRSLAEYIKTDIATPAGYGAYTLYEKSGLLPVTAPCDAAISQANVVGAWAANRYGVVAWWGHGNTQGAYRTYWVADTNGDGIPQSSELTQPAFFTSSNAPSLDNNFPSIVVQISCTNGQPEDTNNLGYALLKNGAIATYSASRVSWYAVTEWYPSIAYAVGDNASYAYFITKRLVQNPTTVTTAAALQWCRENFGTGWAESWMNCLDFNLYGDPTLMISSGAVALPSLSINDVALVEGDSGQMDFTFTVTLSSVSAQTVSVDWATADGTATTADGDYAAASGTLTFSPGQLTKTLTVTVNGDTKYELDETFLVNLTNPSNATVADGQGQGSIQNDDGLPTLSIGDAALAEGDSGTTNFVFTVTLSNPTYQTVTVDWATADGTATTADGDYAAANGTLAFDPGDLSKTLTVTVTGDAKYEPDETFLVNLTNPSNATVADGQGQGSIQNDDPFSAGFDFGASGSPVAAGYFQVTESTLYAEPLGYGWQSVGATLTSRDRGIPSSDYLRRDLNQAPQATFLVNVPNGMYDVTITMGDASYKHDLVQVWLEGGLVNTVSTAIGQWKVNTYRVTVADGQLTVLLKDGGGTDPNAAINALEIVGVGPPVPTLSINDVALTEGNSGQTAFTFTVTLSEASSKTVTVNWATADGTATAAGGDYVAASGLLTFDPGELAKPIVILVNGDTASELDETFVVNLTNPTNAAIERGQGLGAIQNDDAPLVPWKYDFGTVTSLVADGYTRVSEATAYSAAQGYGWLSGTVTSRDRGTPAADYLKRDLTQSNQAAFVVDLANGAYEVTLLMGDASYPHDQMGVYLEGNLVNTVSTAIGQWKVNTYQVTVSDGQLTVLLKDLGGTDPNVVINGLEIAAAGPALPALSINDVALAEGNSGQTAFTFTVTLSEASSETVTVNWTTADGTATVADGDYVPASGVLTFDPGDMTKSITVLVSGDANSELDETFVINLANPTNATIIRPQGLGSIQNDDAPLVPWKYDFGTLTSLVADGYARVAETTAYSAAQGYGWLSGTVTSRDRGSPAADYLKRDLNQSAQATFVVDVANGVYDVTVLMGDASYQHDQMGVYLEGVLVNTVSTAINQWKVNTYQVTVSDGQLTLLLKDLGGTDGNAVVNALSIAPASGGGTLPGASSLTASPSPAPNSQSAFGLANLDALLASFGSRLGSAFDWPAEGAIDVEPLSEALVL